MQRIADEINSNVLLQLWTQYIRVDFISNTLHKIQINNWIYIATVLNLDTIVPI